MLLPPVLPCNPPALPVRTPCPAVAHVLTPPPNLALQLPLQGAYGGGRRLRVDGLSAAGQQHGRVPQHRVLLHTGVPAETALL